MERCPKSLLPCALAALALAAGNGCSSGTPADAGACGQVTCPTGCDISADCSACVPESANAGAGTPCTTDVDCCRGNCVNPGGAADAGTCGASAGSSSGSSGSARGSSSSGGSSGAPSNVAVGGACTASSECSSYYCSGGVCAGALEPRLQSLTAPAT